MKKSFSLFFLVGSFCLLSCTATAQEKLIDSLQQALKQPKIGISEQVFTLGRLANVYSYNDTEKAEHTIQKAISLSVQSTDADAKTYIWAVKSNIEIIQGKDSTALIAVNKALDFSELASPLMRGYAWSKKAHIYSMRNEQSEAVKLWQKALGYLQSPDGAYYQASIYYHLYGVYAEREDFETARHYAQLALKRAKQSGNYNMIAACWQINGSLQLDNFWKNDDKKLLDSAITAYQNSIAVYRNYHGWMKFPPVVVLSALNLANIYAEYYPVSYIDSIESKLNLALKIATEADAEIAIANTYQTIARISFKTGDLDKAERILEEAKAQLDSSDSKNYYASKNIYQLLAKVNEKQGDYQQALADQKTFFQYYKHIFDKRQNQTIQRLEAKYQAQKKEEALRRLQERNAFQKQKTQLYITIAAIAIVLLLALFIAYRFKLKYARQREQLKTEETARLQAEQELIQSQKENLQKEVMAGALQVEHKNELLQNLKERLAKVADSKSTKQLDRILKDELRIDENFEDIRKELNELHPEFFNRLQEKADKKLTQLDLKYCAYFYMKLSTKQIAELMHVAPKSVRMTKYRLKQKLNLGKEEDLVDYLLDQN